MAFGLDYSDARPGHTAMKTAGVRFVMRYIGSSNHTASRHPKFLTRAEAAALHADGFDVGVVFETTAGRADGGRAAGLADVDLAIGELAYCGLPSDLPVYFAVDYDAEVGPKISAYFAAIAEVIGVARTGAYGGYRVVKALRDKDLTGKSWQTYAWSWNSAKQRTEWDPRNDLEQYSNNQRVGGGDVDFNRSMKADFGQWRAGASPSPTPQEETDMAQRDLRPGLDQRSGLILTPKSGGYTMFEANVDNSLDDGAQVKPFAPVTLRVAIQKSGGTWQTADLVVGRGPKDTKQTRPQIKITDKNSVFVSVTRVTGDGTEPITITAY